ncbi:MAG: guanylate kinase [Lachnospiraceae bacterium]|nr:guanylate kinase [Lachnospiraceae bacterium]
MGRIFYLMGKSASGKDRIYRELLKRFSFEKIVMYTTRPMRHGELNGVQYYFTDEAEYECLKEAGKVVEARCYQTVHGPWIYYTVDDGRIRREADRHYLVIGTLESYEKMKQYFGKEMLVALYLEVDNGLRLERALNREKMEENPNYSEICRRYLADEEDFSEEKLKAAGIEKRFFNEKLDVCLKELSGYIKTEMEKGTEKPLSV